MNKKLTESQIAAETEIKSEVEKLVKFIKGRKKNLAKTQLGPLNGFINLSMRNLDLKGLISGRTNQGDSINRRVKA